MPGPKIKIPRFKNWRNIEWNKDKIVEAVLDAIDGMSISEPTSGELFDSTVVMWVDMVTERHGVSGVYSVDAWIDTVTGNWDSIESDLSDEVSRYAGADEQVSRS